MKRLRVLVLLHQDLIPRDSIEGLSDDEVQPWRTEFDVCDALRCLDHNYRIFGSGNDAFALAAEVRAWQPQIVFNLMEEFHNVGIYEPHVVSFLELLRVPYTGCNAQGLMLCHDKALCRALLASHGVPQPPFLVVPEGSRVRRPASLPFPLFVKSTVEDASLGISQQSIVHNDRELGDRVEFIHDELETDALVEGFVEGRELYVGVMGNDRLQTLPIWELTFKRLEPGHANIATERVKWDYEYQEKIGLDTHPARKLPSGVARKLPRLCKQIYRILGLSGYGRLDFRLAADGQPYLLEANPNPNLTYGEDFAESADKAGLDYEDLIQRILNLGLRYEAPWKVFA